MILHPCAFFLSSSVKEEPKNYIYQKGKGTVTFQVHTGHYLPTLICLLRKLHYSYERNFLFLSLFPFSCPSCFVLYVKKEERNGKSCTSFCNVLNSDEMATMEISKNVFNTATAGMPWKEPEDKSILEKIHLKIPRVHVAAP